MPTLKQLRALIAPVESAKPKQVKQKKVAPKHFPDERKPVAKKPQKRKEKTAKPVVPKVKKERKPRRSKKPVVKDYLTVDQLKEQRLAKKNEVKADTTGVDKFIDFTIQNMSDTDKAYYTRYATKQSTTLKHQVLAAWMGLFNFTPEIRKKLTDDIS